MNNRRLNIIQRRTRKKLYYSCRKSLIFYENDKIVCYKYLLKTLASWDKNYDDHI